jgi:hypothetical protein
VIRESINRSKSLARVSLGANWWFRCLLNCCDDYGRLEAAPAVLRGTVCPLHVDQVSVQDIVGWLDELAHADDPERHEGIQGDLSPIVLYEVDRVRYLCMTRWETHRGNSKRGGMSKCPAPPAGACAVDAEPEPQPVVYFVQDAEGRIKIGHTAFLESRLQALRARHGPLDVLATVSGDRARERRYHRRFAKDALGNEWFRNSEALQEEIDTLGQPGQPRAAMGSDGQHEPDPPPDARPGSRGVEESRSRGEKKPSLPARALPEEAFLSVRLLNACILKCTPGGKTAITENQVFTWAVELDRLHRIGAPGTEHGWPWEQIEAVIRWLPTHEGSNGFTWGPQIRSAAKLRVQFPRLHAEMMKVSGGSAAARQDRAQGALQGLLERERHQIHGHPRRATGGAR